MKLSNIKPKDAVKFLKKHGWIFINREGTHETYHKIIDGRDHYCQVIFNNKTIYPNNVRQMIKKSLISKENWRKKFG